MRITSGDTATITILHKIGLIEQALERFLLGGVILTTIKRKRSPIRLAVSSTRIFMLSVRINGINHCTLTCILSRQCLVLLTNINVFK